MDLMKMNWSRVWLAKNNRLWNAWLLLQETVHTIQMSKSGFDSDGDVELNDLGCLLT